jgi:RNA-directed DNA polymerase
MIEEQAGRLFDAGIVRLLADPGWSASHENYNEPVYIPKKNGGRRKILEPKPELKEALRTLVNFLVSHRYGPSRFAHGFVNKRGRRTNALPHVGHARMLKVDIEDFFGSCTPEMVVEALKRLEPPEWVLNLVERMCFLDGGLPQGSPASPMLSNIVARHMDYRLAGLCKNFLRNTREVPISYTRYADDLTFTSDWSGLKQLIHPVGHILANCGFAIKASKTKYFVAPARLESCGVVISKEKINARRRDRLYWRGRLHRMVTDIKFNDVPPGQFKRREGGLGRISKRMLRKIRGKIAAIVDISPQDKENLFRKFQELRSLCGPHHV